MGLFDIFKKKKKVMLDTKVLRKNDISLLFLDERWNSLFVNEEKTLEIIQCENKIKDLLKEQSRLLDERQKIGTAKKGYIDHIIRLTDETYQKNNPSALDKMQDYQRKITESNARIEEIEKILDEIPDRIKDANMDLLEITVSKIYVKIRTGHKRIGELEVEIEKMKSKLKENLTEKDMLTEQVSSSYTYFHDLLGAEELERLDKQFLA